MNSTVDITVGRKGQVICTPAGWTDVVKFFFLNYGLHALSVMPVPGATPLVTFQLWFFAIFLPFAGSQRALLTIYRCAKLEADPLAVAHKSEALCMVWRSRDLPHNQFFEVSPALTNIHGQHPVEILGVWERVKRVFVPEPYWDNVETAGPEPYRIIKVPQDYTVKPFIKLATSGNSATGKRGRMESNFQLSCNYNSIKSLAAILQILYSSFELYESRGLQLQQYGYTSYSLTVIPYLIMSLINLVATLCEPQYPTMFLVNYRGEIGNQASVIKSNPGNEVLFDAHGSLPTGDKSGDIITKVETDVSQTEVLVSGAVGEASEGTARKARSNEYPMKEACLRAVVVFFAVSSVAAPYIIIKLLTNFHRGQSTRSQRVWLMTWLVTGQAWGLYVFIALCFMRLKRKKQTRQYQHEPANRTDERKGVILLFMILVMSTGTIGGFVVIAMMIRHSDVCKTI